jgi:inorganic pyrophosphatase
MKNKDPHLLSNLPAYGEDGSVHAVVESPKGSPLKLKFEIKLGTFTVAHSLPLGLSYPFDWGFVQSTQAPDGDPLDILILHEASTYPGVVLLVDRLVSWKWIRRKKMGRGKEMIV